MSQCGFQVLDWIGAFLWYIAPSLVAVALGGLLVQWFFVRRANEAAFIDLLMKDLEMLRADSLEYWNTLAEGVDEKRRRQILAQKMKGTIKSLSADLRYYCRRYCARRERELTELIAEISDACTGGEFESTPSKKTDNGRYLMIINAIHRLKSELFRRKL